MVSLENLNNHVIKINKFQLNWRFTEEEFCVLPEEHLSQLKPLNKKASLFLDNFISDINLHDSIPFTKGFFKTIDKISFEVDEEKDVKKWLYKRGFPFEKEVILSWEKEIAMIAPWKLVIKYFDEFYYPIADDLTIFDKSLNWAILFFHESEIFFGTNEKYEINKLNT